MSSPSIRYPRGGRKTVIIGFDFGTHSTKVVYRERGKADGHIIRFDENADGYPSQASPSLVRCTNDRLFFGTEALCTSGGQLFTSLKVRLLPGYEKHDNSLRFGLSSRTITAAYFAWAFQQLRQRLNEQSDASLLLNVAAPMSHFENPELKTKYLQVLQAAWNASFVEQPISICQGLAVSEAARIFAPMLKRPVLGSQYRRFEVLPETIAPVVSLSLDPWMMPGMYMIVDIGAATTEMSVFHAGESGADQKVLCYQDETMLLGGNDFHLAERQEDLRRSLTIDKITKRLEQNYRRLWYLGYRLDAPNHHSRKRWKELTLVLSGGGTRHAAVASRLSKTNPMQPWPEDDTDLKVCRHIPGTLELESHEDDDGSMFAVANGLAIERRHWPVIFQRDQIEPLAPTEEVENKPNGYWYLDSK